ncbi:chlorohydrolase [Streptococcus pneumoniae]|uniref:chlorohydrolase n=1 Tax=Streptococcus pneumoniae TaxID=1313 RepID=UPI000B595EBD|nr:chlorohydrolase [Streptococcus pneumoniae]
MKIKEQTRKLDVGCSKHSFEVADKLTWFEEIFEEYDKEKTNENRFLSRKLDLIRQNDVTKSGLSIH